jgi:predicted nucleotidyltransferase
MDFKRGQDPIKSMKLGYGNKLKTKAWKILDFIRSKGEEGVSFTELQKFIWTEIAGNSEEDFYKTSEDIHREYYESRGKEYNPSWRPLSNKTRASRGYYNTALFGGTSNTGLLHKYCEKTDNGKWAIKRMPNPGENIYEDVRRFVPESLNEMINKNRDI